MKLLTVMECLGRGGTEQFLVSLLPALQARGFRTEVLVIGPPLELCAALEERGIGVHVFDASRPRSFAQLPAVAARVADVREMVRQARASALTEGLRPPGSRP